MVLVAICNSSFAQNCNCDDDTGVVFKNQITICGDSNNVEGEAGILLSGITVKNCVTGEILMSDDEIEVYRVSQFPDSVTITDLQLLPDSSMRQLTFAPLLVRVIKDAPDGNIIITHERFIFTVPQITDRQKSYLDTLCLQLKKNIKQKKELYPFDENSIYALFLGALEKYKDCFDLFTHLREYYILDGAIAETWDEIPFDSITRELKLQ